jgi:DNA/RNA-binding domain of Phe-tRNA-synthetase-like protein
MLTVDQHPLLDLRAFTTAFPQPLGLIAAQPLVLELLRAEATAPITTDDSVRDAVRGMLRCGGFKPTGRSKPASEYLLGAARDGRLTPINVAVDVCNVVSLHSGLPISVVDLNRARDPLRVGIAPAGATYVFNLSEQVIDVGGLLCLFDADGPCANAVKDAQRTKTGPDTIKTLSLIWGTTALAGRTAITETWYRDFFSAHGATTQSVDFDSGVGRGS